MNENQEVKPKDALAKYLRFLGLSVAIALIIVAVMVFTDKLTKNVPLELEFLDETDLECYALSHLGRPYDVVIYPELTSKLVNEYNISEDKMNQWASEYNLEFHLMERCRIIHTDEKEQTTNELAPAVYSPTFGEPPVLDSGYINLQTYIMDKNPYHQLKDYFKTVNQTGEFYYMNEYDLFLSIINFDDCNRYSNDEGTEFGYMDCQMMDKSYFYNEYPASIYNKETYLDLFCEPYQDTDMYWCLDNTSNEYFLIK